MEKLSSVTTMRTADGDNTGSTEQISKPQIGLVQPMRSPPQLKIDHVPHAGSIMNGHKVPPTDGPIRQSSRKRRSPRPPGATEVDAPTTLQSVEHSDIKVAVGGSSVHPDKVSPNGKNSWHSTSQKRTSRSVGNGSVDVSRDIALQTGNGDKKAPTQRKRARQSPSSNSGAKDESETIRASTKRQSTRSRAPRVTYESQFNPIATNKEDVDEHENPYKGDFEPTGKTLSIDAIASSLAMLDERGYQRAFLCDSNDILRKIVQPLALPWTHNGNPISRNTAFDIDDMTETLMTDDGSYTPFEKGPFGFGRYDLGQLRRGPTNTRLATSSNSLCSAARRSAATGVLEVSSIVLPQRAHQQTCPIESSKETEESDRAYLGRESRGDAKVPDGEISLRYYQRSAKQKHDRISEVRGGHRRKLVSVKVGSSSSRTSIFVDTTVSNEPRHELLEAMLPSEVQNGKFLSNIKAQQISDALGSYNWRDGFPKESTTGKSSRGTSCGRTRLIWTDKSGVMDNSQKAVYTSTLTGERLEMGAQKRPREIKVALRIQGVIFPAKSTDTSSGVVGLQGNIVGRPECVLHDEEMTKSILADSQRPGFDRSKARVRGAATQPNLACLSDSNGLVSVVCTSPGKVAFSSVHECLNHAARQSPLKCCTICWAPDQSMDCMVNECAECGTLAHIDCCHDPGQMVEKPAIDDSDKGILEWRCAVCCFKETQPVIQTAESNTVPVEQVNRSRRKSKLPQWLQDSHIDDSLPAGRPDHIEGEKASHGATCALCPYHGGSMSRFGVEGEQIWAHDVCRIWQQAATGLTFCVQASKLQCALCGKPERKGTNGASETPVSSTRHCLIRCAGSRCQVHFHPMCALLNSKFNELQSKAPSCNTSIGDHHPFSAQGVDQKLGTSFALSAVMCEAESERNRHSVCLPVGFCGIHNPKRNITSRGLYPAGKLIKDSIRIPALHKQET